MNRDCHLIHVSYHARCDISHRHNISPPYRKHEPDLKKFGWLRKYDDSKTFLQERPVLACEETANYLVIQCINLAMEEKFAAMEQVAHQCIAMQYLMELSKTLNIDPRACIAQFFTK